MWKRPEGTYLGVKAGWHQVEQIDEVALAQVFDSIRFEAANQGCKNFPSREDCATHPALFDVIYKCYSQMTGQRPEKHAFRRNVCSIHKEGGTPE